MDDLPQALIEVRPTLAAAVPRVFEKTYANIMQKGHGYSGLKRRIFDWAMRVASDSVRWKAYGKHAPLSLRLRWGIADRAVYRISEPVWAAACVRSFPAEGRSRGNSPNFSGAWAFRISGLRTGLETSPVVSANRPDAQKWALWGQPIKNVSVRIASDGEISCKARAL